METTELLNQEALNELVKTNGPLASLDLTLKFKNGAVVKVQQQDIVEENTHVVGFRFN